MSTIRRRTGTAIAAVAVAACIGIIATTTATPTGGRTSAAEAATPSTTTTTVPAVGHLADERDLARLTAHADAIEERWGQIIRWVAAVEEAEAHRAEEERRAREEAERRERDEAERAAREEAEQRAREAAATAAPAPTAPASTAPSPNPAPNPAPVPAPAPRPTTGPADRVAAAHGLHVVYGSPTPCGSSGSPTTVAGCHSTATPDRIYLSESGLLPELAYAADQVARHEVAHNKIFRACRTTRPPIARGHHEAVTDAYAALYLGGDGGHGYTAADAEAARSIRSGRCA